MVVMNVGLRGDGFLDFLSKWADMWYYSQERLWKGIRPEGEDHELILGSA